MKTIEQIKKDPWFLSRPKPIQQAILSWPPNQYYTLKETGQIIRLHSYEESLKGKCTTCEIVVIKGRNKGVLVFGVKLASLLPHKEPKS